jgi:hypothetical protein
VIVKRRPCGREGEVHCALAVLALFVVYSASNTYRDIRDRPCVLVEQHHAQDSFVHEDTALLTQKTVCVALLQPTRRVSTDSGAVFWIHNLFLVQPSGPCQVHGTRPHGR